ncbi:MAG: glycosyltransferase family 4 protein [Candidatus Hodarchaeota archaeon]
MRVALVQNITVYDHRMVHIDNVARELTSRGHHVDVIINNSSQSIIMTSCPYKIISLPGETYSIFGQIRFVYNLYKLLRKEKYEIIHSKNPFSSVFPALLNKAHSKVIYDIRGLWIDFAVHAGYIPKQLKKILNHIDIFCMKKVHAVIAISQEMKKILAERGVDDSKIMVIVGAGVNTGTRSDVKDVKDYLDISGRIIGYVGTISRTRSSDQIIQAFSILRKQSHFDTHLVLVGPFSEGEEKYFRKLTNSMQLKNYISFTGFLPHELVLQLLTSFDVVIAYHEHDLPIYNVAVPTKILEYLAAGCAIVTTDQKMYQNVLTNNKDAILTAQNPQAFANGILSVLNNPEISRKLKTNALQTAQKYSIESIVDSIEYMYEKLLSLRVSPEFS